MWAIGRNNQGQLGQGNTTDSDKLVQVKSPDGNGYLENIIKIDAGISHNIALDKDGNVYTWGYNLFGGLGDGTTIDKTLPIKIALQDIVDIAVGAYHAVVIDKNGDVWVWGYNGYGQLGLGDTTDRLNPVKLTSVSNVVKISAEHHTLMLTADGKVYGVGYNLEGQLGDNTKTNRTKPVQVKGINNVGYLENIKYISAGNYMSVAVLTDGTVVTWGGNGQGQLGNGTTTSKSYPVKVKSPDGLSELANISKVSAGVRHVLALTETGKVYAWGYNVNGQLGDGTTMRRLLPVETQYVGGRTVEDAIDVDANFLDVAGNPTTPNQSLIINKEGYVYGFGNNEYSKIGEGRKGDILQATNIRESKIIPKAEEITMNTNEQKQIEILIEGFNVYTDYEVSMENIEYESSDASIATVSDMGIVTAVKGGVVTITIRDTVNNIEATVDVTIEYNLNLKSIKANNTAVLPDEDGIYSALVSADNTEVYIEPEDSNATVAIKDIYEKVGAGTVEVATLSEELELPIIVSSPDKVFSKEYILVLKRNLSDNTNIDILKIKDVSDVPSMAGGDYVEVTDFDESTNMYKASINMSEEKDIYIKAEDENATIMLGSIAQDKGEVSATITDLEASHGTFDVVIVVISQKGTLETYILRLTRIFEEEAPVKGKVITSSETGKHNATVTVYKSSDTRKIDDATNPREVIKEVTTEDSGEYELMLKQETYDIVISKEGYLKHTIKSVIVEDIEIILNDTQLMAGDLNTDGIVNATDYALINRRNNANTENPKYIASYDFNEDGTIETKDRNLLKSNYDKKDTEEIWVKPTVGADDPVRPMSANININEAPEAQYNFILPVTTSYVVTSEWGYRVNPVTGKEELHSAIDMVPLHHSNIAAAADGIVTFAGVQDGYGNCIEIKHTIGEETMYTFYVHLSEINVVVGQAVSQGNVIGKEGGDATDPNPGTSTGHHLHFEIKTASEKGNSTNPRDYIKELYLTSYAIEYEITGEGWEEGVTQEWYEAMSTKYHDVSYTITKKMQIREGYTMLGWTTKGADKTTMADVEYHGGEEYTENVPLKLYPVWQKN